MDEILALADGLAANDVSADWLCDLGCDKSVALSTTEKLKFQQGMLSGKQALQTLLASSITKIK